jgi:hypothetical protein
MGHKVSAPMKDQPRLVKHFRPVNRTERIKKVVLLGFAFVGCGGIVDVPAPADSDPLAAAKHYATAVCACGDGWPGCFANAFGEVERGDPECLELRAEAYEQDCTGRSASKCSLYP